MSFHGSAIIPSLRYRDAHAAIDWLVRVFGLRRQAVYDAPDGTVAHAQLTHRGGMLMIGSASTQGDFARHSISLDDTGGRETVGLCIIVTDDECLALYDRVKASGVEVLHPLSSPDYGGKSFACRDIEGHIWWIASYNPWAEYEAPTAEGTA